MTDRANDGQISRLRTWVMRRVSTSNRLAPSAQAARLLMQEYRRLDNELLYQPADWWRDELVALRNFMRRAFQVLQYNGIDGDYAEFGCYGARTFRLAWGAARLVGHPAHHWAFDSFEGLPQSSDLRDEHEGWNAGVMAMTEQHFIDTCTSHGIPRDAFTTVPGFFADSLQAPGATLPERICFAYIDCDLYSSTVDVLQFLAPRLRHGMVLAFDDYYCYGRSMPSGERLALTEFIQASERWRLLPFVQWGWYGMSFIVEDRSVNPTSPIGH